MSIARGAVKIDKSPNLCFVNTMNWSQLGVKRVNYIDTTPEDVCERCPLECKGFCWDANHCQEPIETCHKECLGCYKNKRDSPRGCKVCKNFEDDGLCVSSCPPNKYTHTMLNKCVTKEVCENLLPDAWWTHKRLCLNGCPELYKIATKQNYDTGKLDHYCEFCGDNCVKHCTVIDEIDATDQLDKLKGCTHINGSIVIKMSNAEPSDLQKNLGAIRHISGMLMIARTMRLSSLGFLRKVTYIGKDTSKEFENYANYSIFMYENQNLQQLWNFTKLTLTLNGTIGFHNNPLLCLSEIKKLANATKVVYTDLDVSPFSNGDEASCVIKKLNVMVFPNSTKVNLTWYPPKQEKGESYIGYTVFYKEEKDRNATTFDSKDVCVVTEWTSLFATNNSIELSNLSPNSTYAYYIKMYVSSNSTTQGSQSNMKYFQTLPDDPDGFDSLTVTPIDHQSVLLSWTKPLLPNGVLAQYVLDFDELHDELIYERDYCKNPRSSDGDEVDNDEIENDFRIDAKGYNKTTSDPIEDNCTCAKLKVSEADIDYAIVTKDSLFDICHSVAQSGKSTCKNFQYYSTDRYLTKEKFEKRNSKKQFIPANETTYIVTNLSPFTLYIFYFSACNYPIEENRCSGILQRFARTKKRPDADQVEQLTIDPLGESSVEISWTRPKNPNSDILAYHISLISSSSELRKDCLRVNESQKNMLKFVIIYPDLRPADYTVYVTAQSLAGESDFNITGTFKVWSPNKHVVLVAVSVTCLICLGVTVGIYIYFKKFKRSQQSPLISTVNPEYVGFLYVQDEWEVDRDDIEIIKGLGQGTFGTVFQGIIKSRNNLPCAIKTVNENLSLHDRMTFLNEASVMKAFNECYHVVKLLGVVSATHPPLVIMELLERGDLKRCLRKTRDSSHNLTSTEIYRMAVEIADGMAYLSAKKFVHRDLAARNCLVAGDRTVKIGDFGMARDIYETDYYRKETKGLLPVRWMAPESLADGVFTTDSDVWSFGVVLWEIATLAEQPYQGLSNEQVLQFVISRGRLTRPQECSDLLYEVMRKCWSWRPSDRPSFWDIVELLEDKVSEDFKFVAFVYSREASLYSRERVENHPALGVEPRQDLLCHYNADDEEVSLHVGGVPKRASCLQTSLNQRRFSPTDDFY